MVTADVSARELGRETERLAERLGRVEEGVTQRLRELERNVERLTEKLSRVEEQATRRLDEWGPVRARADRVEELEARLRELARSVERLQLGQPMAAETTTAPAPGAQPADLDAVVLAVLEQMQSGDVADWVRELIQQHVTEAVNRLDMEQIAQQVYVRLEAAGVEEKLAQTLVSRAASAINTEAVTSALADQLLKRLNVESVLQTIASQIAHRLSERLVVTVTTRR